MVIRGKDIKTSVILKDISDTLKEINEFENEIRDRKKFVKDLESIINYRQKNNIVI